MRNKLVMILGLVLLTGLTTAGVLLSWEKDIDLTSEQITQIKESGNTENIDVLISEIKCDGVNCWAKIYQKDVINSEFRTLKNYCVKYNECKLDIFGKQIDPECEKICLEYEDYTIDELKQMTTDYVNMRLGEWADAEIERKEKVIQSITGEGKVSEK